MILIPDSQLLMPSHFVNWLSIPSLSTRFVPKPNKSCGIKSWDIIAMSIYTLLINSFTVFRNSSDNRMWCLNSLLVSRQRQLRLLLVLILPSMQFIMTKVSPLTSLFLVSSLRILVDAKIMLVLTVRLVGYSLQIIILVCNMIRLVVAKHRQSNGYINGYKSIELLSKQVCLHGPRWRKLF